MPSIHNLSPSAPNSDDHVLPAPPPMYRLAERLDPVTRAHGLAFLAFEKPDITRASRFLQTFGLEHAAAVGDRLYLRGADQNPYCLVLQPGRTSRFLGLGLAVDSAADLARIAAEPGASAVLPNHTPGGGHHVLLRDPGGFLVAAVHGFAPQAPIARRQPLCWNSVAVKLRRNAVQRPARSPEVVRLGHVVLEYVRFAAALEWYRALFGLLPTDVQCLPDGRPAVAFLRCDTGRELTDHHTLVIARGVENAYNHSAYEVVDVDAVAVGQRILRDAGYDHAWGIGRHLLGSQIFDYWSDPWGDKFEHFTDGDVFDSTREVAFHPISRQAMSQWGPIMPKTFVDTRMGPARMLRILRNLRHSRGELTLELIVKLKQALA